jgi:hypothetical protein
MIEFHSALTPRKVLLADPIHLRLDLYLIYGGQLWIRLRLNRKLLGVTVRMNIFLKKSIFVYLTCFTLYHRNFLSLGFYQIQKGS